MLVKLARNFFTKSGELFYAHNNPNLIGEEHRKALPPDAVVLDELKADAETRPETEAEAEARLKAEADKKATDKKAKTDL